MANSIMIPPMTSTLDCSKNRSVVALPSLSELGFLTQRSVSANSESSGSSSPLLCEESDVESLSPSVKRGRDEDDKKNLLKRRRSSVSSDASEDTGDALSEVESMPSSPVSSPLGSPSKSPSKSPKKTNTKRAPSPISLLKSPINMTREEVRKEISCIGNGACALCKNGIPYYLHNSMNPGWRETIIAMFQFFPKRRTKSEWAKLQKMGEQVGDLSDSEIVIPAKKETEWLYFPDAYTFVENHWRILCPPTHKDKSLQELNWRKTIQDTFSHNKGFFASGKKVFGRTGFWRISDKAPIHTILKESNRLQVERITSKANACTQAIQACVADSMTFLPLTLVNTLPQSVTRPVAVSIDFSNMSFLLDAIDSITK